MTAFAVAGILTTLAFIVLMGRISLKRFLAYSNTVDLVFFGMIVVLFHDTFSGLITGAFAGCFMSAALWVMRRVYGYEYAKFRMDTKVLFYVGLWKWKKPVKVPVIRYTWVRVYPKYFTFIKKAMP